MKKCNPFYYNYIFKKEDINRIKIKWYEYPILWILPTYVQCSDNYAWFYKLWQGRIYFIKEEKLFDWRREKSKEEMMSDELKSCPCGKTPTALQITSSGNSKWAWVSGNCCGEWNVEFRTQYNPLDSPECMNLATEAWNSAERADDKKITELEKDLKLWKGAVAADDERLKTAADKIGRPYWGNDTPDAMAGVILKLEKENARLKEKIKALKNKVADLSVELAKEEK